MKAVATECHNHLLSHNDALTQARVKMPPYSLPRWPFAHPDICPPNQLQGATTTLLGYGPADAWPYTGGFDP